VKYSIVIPAKNEADSIAGTVAGLVDALEGAAIDYEVIVVDDASTDTTRSVVDAIGASNPRVRCHPSHNPPGFGFAVRAGFDVFTGDAVAVVMADGSDSPADVVRYYEVLEAGHDCAFGSRFVSGARIVDYPRSKLIMNRIVNLGIRVLFRHGYNDTTNAF
jgi:dolichol-phosphate mannosyltransferase